MSIILGQIEGLENKNLGLEEQLSDLKTDYKIKERLCEKQEREIQKFKEQQS